MISATCTAPNRLVNAQRVRSLMLVLGLACLLCLPAQVAAEVEAEPIRGRRYVCLQLEEALRDLRDRGLKVIYSSDLVQPGVQITTAPLATTPRTILEQILAPFGVEAKDAGDGVLLIVRSTGDAGATNPAGSLSGVSEGVLPIWIEGRDVVEWAFPSSRPDALDASSRFLVLRFVATDFDDWKASAFELKNRIVEARSQAPGLRVAVDGDPATVSALVSLGLAPYVDAYLYRDQPSVPAADATAHLWWRVSAPPGQVLNRLLEADARGAEVVIFDNLRLDDLHQAFLSQIQNTLSADLDVQPPVAGIAQERVRFFLQPETGDHYLAVYARGS